MFRSGWKVVRETSSLRRAGADDALPAPAGAGTVLDDDGAPLLEQPALNSNSAPSAEETRAHLDRIGFMVRKLAVPSQGFPSTSSTPLMTAIESHTVPAVGQQAPDFTLQSTSGEKVTLSALRGKPVLIAFFPLAFTSTCTEELCEMRDDHDQFVQRGVTVLPISVDSTYSLKEYKAKYNMHVDLLSDFKREVSRLYGVLLEDRFYSNRAYFLLDRDGVIRWVHVEENPGQRRPDSEILAAIDRL